MSLKSLVHLRWHLKYCPVVASQVIVKIISIVYLTTGTYETGTISMQHSRFAIFTRNAKISIVSNVSQYIVNKLPT